MENWLKLHPKVGVGGIVALFLTVVAPWAAAHGVDVLNIADPNIKLWLPVLAGYLTPGGQNAVPAAPRK